MSWQEISGGRSQCKHPMILRLRQRDELLQLPPLATGPLRSRLQFTMAATRWLILWKPSLAATRRQAPSRWSTESMWKKPGWSTVSSKATEVLWKDRRELKKPHKRGTPPFLACLSTRLHFLHSIAGPRNAVEPHESEPHEASGRSKATALVSWMPQKKSNHILHNRTAYPSSVIGSSLLRTCSAPAGFTSESFHLDKSRPGGQRVTLGLGGSF